MNKLKTIQKKYQRLNLLLINTSGKRSQSKYWKNSESKNKSITLNILYIPHNTIKVCHAYKSKYNSTRENQVILLMITDGEKWHYLAVKSLSTLLKGITSKHKEDFYCLNCSPPYTTKNKLKRHKNVRENDDYCCVDMPNEDNKILKYNHGEKSMKVPLIIYADLESLLKKWTLVMIVQKNHQQLK